MAGKKVEMPPDIFDEQPGAIAKLTGAAPRRPAPAPEPTSRPALAAPISQAAPAPAAAPARTGQTRNVKPTSIYLTPEQLRKLDDLAYTYNGRTGKRLNRNDIVRHLVDVCDIGTLQGL